MSNKFGGSCQADIQIELTWMATVEKKCVCEKYTQKIVSSIEAFYPEQRLFCLNCVVFKSSIVTNWQRCTFPFAMQMPCYAKYTFTVFVCFVFLKALSCA